MCKQVYLQAQRATMQMKKHAAGYDNNRDTGFGFLQHAYIKNLKDFLHEVDNVE